MTFNPQGEILIRKASLKDASAVSRVHVDSWRETYYWILPAKFLKGLSYDDWEKTWKSVLSDSSVDVHVVQEKNDSIGGFVAVGPLREAIQGFNGELYAIYLLKRLQGLGYGKRLFETGVRSLIEDGVKSMALWVLRDNPTCGFYEHMGGAIVGEKTIQIAGQDYVDIAYGWKRLNTGSIRAGT